MGESGGGGVVTGSLQEGGRGFLQGGRVAGIMWLADQSLSR